MNTASIIADMREWRARNPDADPITVGGEELDAMLALDWRVLGGLIPGLIPVDWVQVGDRIRDHGVEGVVSRVVPGGRMVHVYIDSGHVSFAKITRQDWIHVLEASDTEGANQ